MATDERARAELFERLDGTLGPDAADTLMGHLPPAGWADVATKQDLAQLKAELEASFERALRQAMVAIITSSVAVGGAVIGLSQLLR